MSTVNTEHPKTFDYVAIDIQVDSPVCSSCQLFCPHHSAVSPQLSANPSLPYWLGRTG